RPRPKSGTRFRPANPRRNAASRRATVLPGAIRVVKLKLLLNMARPPTPGAPEIPEPHSFAIQAARENPDATIWRRSPAKLVRGSTRGACFARSPGHRGRVSDCGVSNRNNERPGTLLPRPGPDGNGRNYQHFQAHR